MAFGGSSITFTKSFTCLMEFKSLKLYFVTITVNNWIPVFRDMPETQNIILESFRYLKKNENITIYGFVIMRDHIHFIMKCSIEKEAEQIVTQFKQHTGRHIINFLKDLNSGYLENFISERKDREHKFWKIRGGLLLIQSKPIYQQKLSYIHQNPCKGDYKSVATPEEYHMSSAKAYSDNISNFSFLALL